MPPLVQVQTMPQTYRLAGKTVLVACDSVKDNARMVSDLLDAGATVVWAYSGPRGAGIDQLALHGKADPAARTRLHLSAFDGSYSDNVDRLAAYCVEELSSLDAVVVNFGDHEVGPKLVDTSVQDLERTVNCRFYSHLVMARTFTPLLAKRKTSAYIFVNDNNSLSPTHGGGLRSAAAAAELALAKSLAFEMGGRPYVYSLVVSANDRFGSIQRYLTPNSVGEAIGLIVQDPSYAKNQVVVHGSWREALDPSAQAPEYCSNL